MTTFAAPTASPKLPLIQVGRGLAAVLVLLFHIGILLHAKTGIYFFGNIFTYAGIGVEFFFVLSGFIIYFVHRDDIGRPARAKAYAIKRFIRIYPLYWLVLLPLTLAFLLLPGIRIGYETQPLTVFSSFLLIPQSHLPILPVAWTICYEVLFYLLFLATIIIPRKKISIALIIGWFAVTTANLWQIQPFTDHGYFFDFLFGQFNFYFLAGVLAGAVVKSGALRPWHYPVFLLGGLTIAVITHIFPIGTVLPVGMIFSRIEIALFFLIVGLAGTQINRAPKLLMLVGDASYALYLIHYPLISFAFMLLPDMRGNIILIQTAGLGLFLVANAGAVALHLFVEKPLLDKSRKSFLPKTTNVSSG